jgi:hypothetical protein
MTRFIRFDDPHPTPPQVRRLIDDVATRPERPVGPHLDDEEFYRLLSGTLSAASRAMAHLESCPLCASEAVEALQEERLAAAVEEEVDGEAALSPLEDREWLEVDPVVASFVSVPPLAMERLLTRAISWQRSTSVPELFCAIDDERAPGVAPFIFRVRTSDATWGGKPLRFVIRDTDSGATVADSWIVLHPKRSKSDEERGETSVEGEAAVDAVGPRRWTAWLAGYVFDPSNAPGHEEIDRLRRIIGGATEVDRDAWRAWLDRETAAGRLSRRIQQQLLGKA